jgi:hypothetical protein
LMSKSAAGTPFTRHTASGYWVVPSVLIFASSSTFDATVGPSTDTQVEVLAADCFRAPESTMTFTPAQASPDALEEAGLEEAALEEAPAEAGAEEAEALGWLAAGVEQPARAIRRPAAASEPAAAVRILVKVTCQG